MPKKREYPNEDWPLANNGWVTWESTLRRDPEQGWIVTVFCGVRGHEPRDVCASHVLKLKPGDSAPCRTCHNDRMRAQRQTAEFSLPKGTYVLPDVRARSQFAIRCRRCFDPPLDNLKFVERKTINCYIKAWLAVYALTLWSARGDASAWCALWSYLRGLQFWDELCRDCVRQRGSTRKFGEDKKSKISDTWTLFGSLVVDGMVGTYYGLCKCLYWATEESARNNWDQRIDVCPYHDRRPRELRARLEFLGLLNPENGSGQKIVMSKKRGPDKGFNAKVTEEKIRAAFKELGRYTPQEILAERIGVDPRSLRKWHKERGLSYQQLRQQFSETGGS